MSIKIGSNIASVQAQRRLGEASSSLEKSYQRLSSGQRINSAADDAAGLAIADDLKAKDRVYTQAIRNGNDGLSLLNIADSAINSLTGVVTRIRELAEQSSNGIYSGKQRQALDQEAQALRAEYARIAKTTSFNGIKLFDGSLGSGVTLQLGFGNDGSIKASVGGAAGTGVLTASDSRLSGGTNYSDAILKDLNGDGILDMAIGTSNGGAMVQIHFGKGDGTFGSTVLYSVSGDSANAIQFGDLNGDGILDLVAASYGFSNTSTSVRLGNGDGTFGALTSNAENADFMMDLALGDLNNDGILDMVFSGSESGLGVVNVRLGNGNGTFGSVSLYTAGTFQTHGVRLADFNNDGNLDLMAVEGDASVSIRMGAGNGTFGAATNYTIAGSEMDARLGDINGDGYLDIVTSGAARFGTANGTFGAIVAISGDHASANLSLEDLDNDGILDLVTLAYTGQLAVQKGKGNGTFESSIYYPEAQGIYNNNIVFGDLNRDGVLDLVASNESVSTAFLNQTQDGLALLTGFSLRTRADSLTAITYLQQVQESLSKQRGVLGSYQSRISIALNNLSSSKENFKAAESRIRDADVASEAGNLVRTQILQQAASAVLAQANQTPQLALKLLGGS